MKVEDLRAELTARGESDKGTKKICKRDYQSCWEEQQDFLHFYTAMLTLMSQSKNWPLSHMKFCFLKLCTVQWITSRMSYRNYPIISQTLTLIKLKEILAVHTWLRFKCWHWKSTSNCTMTWRETLKMHQRQNNLNLLQHCSNCGRLLYILYKLLSVFNLKNSLNMYIHVLKFTTIIYFVLFLFWALIDANWRNLRSKVYGYFN